MSENNLKTIDPTVRAAVVPASLDGNARTVDVVFATESPVRRYSYNDGEVDEILDISSAAIRGGRLDTGAPVLDSHGRWSASSVVGKVERFWIEGKKAYATLRFSRRQSVEDVWDDIKDGILTSVSVGYNVHKYEVTREDGKTPVYRAVDWEPMEVSIVAIPADANAKVRAIDSPPAMAAENQQPDIELDSSINSNKPEIERGIDPISITPKPTVKMEPLENEIITPPAVVDEAAIRASAMKAERERITSVRGIVERSGLPSEVTAELIANATDKGTSLEAVRSQVLDAVIARQEAINSTRVTGEDETDKRRGAVEAALIIRSGSGVAGCVKLTEQERTLSRQERGKTMLDLCKESLTRSGVSFSGLLPMEIAARALTSSTSDFPVLLEGVARRILLANYEEEPDVWRQFCAIGSVSDFRESTQLRLGSLEDLQLVKESGEFKVKAITDADFERTSVKTYGSIINVSRQMIVNDDLSGFTRLASMLGRTASRTIENLVFDTLLLNSGNGPALQDGNPVFHARSGGNNIGASSALEVEGVDADRVLMRKQKDKDANAFLNIFPSLLLVSLENEAKAKIVNNAEYDPDVLNVINRPNSVRGLFSNIIATPRLTGNTRYLFADPMRHPVFQVSFLQGEESPFVEQMPGFDVDGIKWKIRHDFGVNGVGFRGAVKNVGG